jgi:hypothetical protein
VILFRRRRKHRLCADQINVGFALQLISEVMAEQVALPEYDRNIELLDVLLDIRTYLGDAPPVRWSS